MKKHLIIVTTFLIFLISLPCLPVWANEQSSSDFFEVDHLINEEDIYFYHIDNKHYVTYDKNKEFLSIQHFDSILPSPSLVKITSPLNEFRITDYDSGELLFSDNTNYIIIDTHNYFYEASVTIYTNNGSYIWDHNKNTIVCLYFEGEIDFRPIINGEELFITNVDEPLDVLDIKEYLIAIDDIDGDLSSEIFVHEDNYSKNNSKLGKYEIIYGVKDSSNNVAYLTVSIIVVDITPPKISGNFDLIEVSYQDIFDVETFMNSLEVTDNYDIDLELETFENTYVGNENKIGNYQLGIRASDSSENIYEVIKEIVVVDRVAPVITGQEQIEKSLNEEVTLNDIVSLFSAYDDYDGNLTNKIKVIENDYSNNMYKLGSYMIRLQVEDSSNNEAFYTLYVDVLDTQKPIFYISKDVKITTPLNYELSSERLEKILKNHQSFKNDLNKIVKTEFSNYNSSKEGLYKISIDYLDNNEKIQKANILINVYDQNNKPPVEVGNSNNNYLYLLLIPVLATLFVSAYIIIKKQKNKI